MEIIADLQIHSKYSRAVSQEMVIPKIWEWAKKKGIGLVATGDWTHPLWMREIKTHLVEDGSGLLKLKGQNGPLFLLATEISSIYSQGGKLRRIHNLIWAPSISVAEKINKALFSRGANLMSDGRPIVGLTSLEIVELVLSLDSRCLVIPAHVWTPWFSLYGSESGFDSIEECFGSYAKYIYAVETGLSSSPAMNWRIKELDNRAIVSFSDAHSGPKLGREATVFALAELSYEALYQAILNKKEKENKIFYTIEFYPEEGKYHYTGHRNCGVRQSPEETKKKGAICPVCGKRLTIGVMHRVEELAGRSEEDLQLSVFLQFLDGETKIQMVKSNTFPYRPPYVMLVPLQEILAETIGGLPSSQNVQNEYQKLTDYFGGEFNVLLKASLSEISHISGERVAEALRKVRTGEIVVEPGYDGVFGKVKIWQEEKKEEKETKTIPPKEQMSLF